MKNWESLNKKQKEKYAEYCNGKFGHTFTKCETGEPLYFEESGKMINTQIVIDLLFSNEHN
jgi:hypothetical protein